MSGIRGSLPPTRGSTASSSLMRSQSSVMIGLSRFRTSIRRKNASSRSARMPLDGSWLWSMRGVASRFASFRREKRRHENAERTGGIDEKELRLQPWPSWCGGSNPAGEDADHDPSGRRSARLVPRPGRFGWRSEEHTSELQSLAYLVCRLLLEKKKYSNRLW